MYSVRAGYQELGIEDYYKKHNEDYTNHHYNSIKYLLKEYLKAHNIGKDILDLCCGSGEVTRILSEVGEYNIDGLDPYTGPAYKKNTGKDCLIHDFKDIVNGAIENERYDTVICSFAMHLCEESMLNNLLYQLSRITNKLIILTPHKRPEIKNWFKLEDEILYNKVKLRIYLKN